VLAFRSSPTPPCHDKWPNARRSGPSSADSVVSSVMMKLRCWAVGLMLFSWSDSASGAGLWNLPTTARQYWGVGYGAGYHAPLVVGNPWRGTAASPGVSRVPAPLWDRHSVTNPFAPTSLAAPNSGLSATPEGFYGQRSLPASPLFEPPTLETEENRRHLWGDHNSEIYLEPVTPAP
jgi:hypothetical protein